VASESVICLECFDGLVKLTLRDFPAGFHREYAREFATLLHVRQQDRIERRRAERELPIAVLAARTLLQKQNGSGRQTNVFAGKFLKRHLRPDVFDLVPNLSIARIKKPRLLCRDLAVEDGGVAGSLIHESRKQAVLECRLRLGLRVKC
jgi:hypothetical protein